METLHKTIYEAAKASGMLISPRNTSTFHPKQPWFDRECLAAKKSTESSFCTCRNAQFLSPAVVSYRSIKKTYFDLIDDKRQAYFNDIRERIANAKAQSDFWRAFRSCTVLSPSPELDVEVWQSFYAVVYPSRVVDFGDYSGSADQRLDGSISLGEIKSVLVAAKCGKTAGSDSIPAEFYKALPPAGMLYLLNLFNKILSEGVVPDYWHEIILTMIFKKSDKTKPENYRGIALVVVAKLFTKILCSRLDKWAEEANIYPEAQAGFRKERSTLDNIFVALATV
ncbi:uncharacterized protein LOC107042424 [Diachasma alloeum]|uniref:uncharacterized protein LOC107042424 n=1 Tax=Diachasma alloeum TaxID=454923 RepID=UPI00073846EF|nr:uncharacterized protein LOC107042424 [Diachasma alloeum]